MKWLLPILLALGGCSTVVPVTQTFPEVPPVLLKPCDKLQPLADNASLSTVARTVAQNYQSYHECELRYTWWQEWYLKQQIIYKGFK